MKLDDIVTVVYDRLRQDNRTFGIHWEKGYRSPAMQQKIPAGTVYLDQGRDIMVYTGGGRETTLGILLNVRERNEEVSLAEAAIYTWIDKIIEVMTDNRDLTVEAVLDSIDFKTSSSPEAQPPDARVALTLNVTVHLH